MKKLLLIVLLMPTMANAQKDLLINYDTVMVPVELIYFKGYEKGGLAFIEWSTASELNNDHFYLEYSNNGIDFFPYKVIRGQGTSIIKHVYNTVADYNKYFRLTQVDFYSDSVVIGLIMIPRNSEPNFIFRYYDISGRDVSENYRGLKIKAKM